VATSNASHPRTNLTRRLKRRVRSRGLADAEIRILEDGARRADLRAGAVARAHRAKLEAFAAAGRAEAGESGRAMIRVTRCTHLLLADRDAAGLTVLGDDGTGLVRVALASPEQLAVLQRHAHGRLLIDVDEILNVAKRAAAALRLVRLACAGAAVVTALLDAILADDAVETCRAVRP